MAESPRARRQLRRARTVSEQHEHDGNPITARWEKSSDGIKWEYDFHLDRSGYLRFRRWRFYAEAGLAKKPVIVHLSTNALRVEYENTDLALYTVIRHEDYKHITEVANPHVLETSYRSPQLTRLPAWT